jgi:predicted murein hydrolase (TIGR00659 family)
MKELMPLTEVWVYLQTKPLLWLGLTLLAYLCGQHLFLRSGRNPIINPVAIAALLLGGLLLLTGTPYETYFEGAQFVHFLLGPATVALAIPLYTHARRVRKAVLPLIVALFTGSLTAVGSAVLIAQWMGASDLTLRSLVPKSVTTPIAMGIAEQIGGLPSLTAGLVVVTGIVGAIIVTPLMNRLGFRDYRARGFALGLAAHGIGTARAFQVHEVAGVFAAVAMALNGLVTALTVGLLMRFF